jgi:hypothetical protein
VSKVFFEPQIQQRKDDSFILHVTISRYDGVWTSPPVKLKATDWGAAQAEARPQVVELIKALKGED